MFDITGWVRHFPSQTEHRCRQLGRFSGGDGSLGKWSKWGTLQATHISWVRMDADWNTAQPTEAAGPGPFGLVRPDGTAKPALAALTSALRSRIGLLGGSAYAH
jgi:hypothetical protein